MQPVFKCFRRLCLRVSTCCCRHQNYRMHFAFTFYVSSEAVQPLQNFSNLRILRNSNRSHFSFEYKEDPSKSWKVLNFRVSKLDFSVDFHKFCCASIFFRNYYHSSDLFPSKFTVHFFVALNFVFSFETNQHNH